MTWSLKLYVKQCQFDEENCQYNVFSKENISCQGFSLKIQKNNLLENIHKSKCDQKAAMLDYLSGFPA